ncbi:hypothetical protein [Methylomonas koyamae]|nr:hypothetical protein [Methylomonas koyamae]
MGYFTRFAGAGGGGAAKRDLSRDVRPGSPLDRSVAAGRNPAEREVL